MAIEPDARAARRPPIYGPQERASRSLAQIKNIRDPAEPYILLFVYAEGGPDSLQASAIGGKVDRSANRRGRGGGQRVDVGRVPVNRVDQSIMNDVRHAEADSIAIAVLAQAADVDAIDVRRGVP